MLTIGYDAPAFRRAMGVASDALARYMDLAISRSLHEMARDAKRGVPKAFSTLANAIRVDMTGPFEGTAGPHVDYAPMVEQGTGPGGAPSVEAMDRWIGVKGIEPRDPRMTRRDLAYVVARAVRARGTPAQPYLQPAFEGNRTRAERRIGEAVDAALRAAAS